MMGPVDIETAYRRVSTDGVRIGRPGRGLVRLTGPQRVWFLQNTITADVDDLVDGRWVESCFLDVKGKVLAQFRVGALGEVLWLDVEAPGTGPLVDWLTRNRFRTKVEIEDVSPGCVSVVGPAASTPAGVVRAEGEAVVFGDRLGEHALEHVHGGDATGAVDEALWEVLRVEAGLGRFGVDFGPATLPQEAGLTRLVSVTKGCYIGQEVMARLHFRGHVNRVVRALSFEGDPDVADLVGRDLLADEGRVGTVTSAVRSPARGPIGLGLVRVTIPDGAEVTVDGGPTAEVGPIPEGTKVSSS